MQNEISQIESAAKVTLVKIQHDLDEKRREAETWKKAHKESLEIQKKLKAEVIERKKAEK